MGIAAINVLCKSSYPQDFTQSRGNGWAAETGGSCRWASAATNLHPSGAQQMAIHCWLGYPVKHHFVLLPSDTQQFVMKKMYVYTHTNNQCFPFTYNRIHTRRTFITSIVLHVCICLLFSIFACIHIKWIKIHSTWLIKHSLIKKTADVNLSERQQHQKETAKF